MNSKIKSFIKYSKELLEKNILRKEDIIISTNEAHTSIQKESDKLASKILDEDKNA